LPTVLLGHIVPSLTVASLIGIRPLCKAGCTVVFDDKNVKSYSMTQLFYEGARTPLQTYGRCQSDRMYGPPQDPMSCHDPAPV
jgi:hypothetical protein